MLGADGEQPHMRSKVPMWSNYEKVYVLHFGLGPLLKKAVVHHIKVRVIPKGKSKGQAQIDGEHGQHLLLESIPNPSVFGAGGVLVSRMPSVGVPHFVNIHQVQLYQVGVIVGCDIVSYHKANELVHVQMLVCEDWRICFMSAQKEAPVNVCSNGYSHVTKVVCA